MKKVDYKSYIKSYFRIDENTHITNLVESLKNTSNYHKSIHNFAMLDAKKLREEKLSAKTLDAVMTIYPISSKEGQSLLEMAEALIRIPDGSTSYKLLADKLKNKHWFTKIHNNLTLNIYAVGLGFSKFLLNGYNQKPNFFQKLLLPIITPITKIIIKNMATQFVVAENMPNTLKRISKTKKSWQTFSFDMLGEVARTAEDAQKYFLSYQDCIAAIKKDIENGAKEEIYSISVKLSSLNPCYDILHIEDSFSDVYHKIFTLCQQAKEINIPLFIDAEEADKLEYSLELFSKILQEEELKDWNGFGIVVQAYQKRSFSLISYLYDLAKENHRKIFLRLVKGAYWDSEIKIDQVNGVTDFSVFTRKEHTDISYMACVNKLSHYTDIITPCFATHNLHTINFVKEVMKNQEGKYEFQCLFGMGDDVYKDLGLGVRVYAPVGTFKDLLPYLVRRLLENGAKTNFVNAIINTDLSIAEVVENPIEKARKHKFSRHPLIKLPRELYLDENRLNSSGVDMADIDINQFLLKEMNKVKLPQEVFPIINGEDRKGGTIHNVINPSNLNKIGSCHFSTEEQMNEAITIAANSQASWNNLKGDKRATILLNMADKLETSAQMVAVLSQEAGKTVKDAVLEVREAVDFLRYYGNQAKEEFTKPIKLPSVDGENNYLQLEGRGVFLCIAPWNFPLAIFLGQIAAALAAGNTVLAKPAEATNIVGYLAIQKFLEAGLPKGVLHFIPGFGKDIGDYILSHKELGGVAFTGSDTTARYINKALASREDAILPLVAETGGQNCMIVSSSALIDQVARDVVSSSFQSAGQRCSALRVLYVQEEIYEDQIRMIKGAAQMLKVNVPWDIATDVGPIIDQKALKNLISHKEKMTKEGKLLFEVGIPEELKGYYFPPCAFEIPNINVLQKEVFGPILHVIKYKSKDLQKIINDINSTGYGLTFGLHSRIGDDIDSITQQIKAGNIYVNRNQIGAVVGSQPFGGRGKSGTGPKAGGPYYLHRFATEKTITIDVTASGGNVDLLNKAFF